MSDQYELVTGLEVHIQLNTASKMFCGCSNDAVGALPNTLVCPVCYGMPGTLPVANKEAIRKTLLLGKALNAELSGAWNFERKNYFYPDLPKGYQITSSHNPPLIGGAVTVLGQSASFAIRIHHIHLEEDAGKLTHGKDGYSYVDLNRSGTPLIELVTEPDFRSAEIVKRFLQDMRLLVRILGISDGDMENGHLRCDANVSVRHRGIKALGTKVEIKNLNSFSMVEKAISHEFRRQVDIIELGKAVVQETRGWDDARGVTTGSRSKEEAEDYRYMSEPDIPPIVRAGVIAFSDEALNTDIAALELPEHRISKLQRYDIPGKLTDEFIQEDALYGLVIDACEIVDAPQARVALAMFMHDPIIRFATEHSLSFADVALTAPDIVTIFNHISSGKLTHQLLKLKLPALLNGSMTLLQLEHEASASANIDIDSIVAAVLKEQDAVVGQWESGNQKVYGFLVGQVMAKTKGRADPALVHQSVTRALVKKA